MTPPRRNPIWAVTLLLPVLGACTVGEAVELPDVQTTPVVRGDLMITAEATGTVEPLRKVEVKSKASGEILRMFVEVGDEVQAGDLLATIDPRDVQNEFDQAEADLQVAQARFGISEARLARSTELKAQGVISAQEHESRDVDFADAQAALVKGQTNMELARLRRQDVTIRSPVAGTILERNVEEGQIIQSASQNVSSGTTLLVMANLDRVQVRMFLKESEMGEIVLGMTALVHVDAYPDRIFAGVVDMIEPQAVVQQNVTLFPAIVWLDNAERLLKPGMNTEIEIQVAQVSDVLLIPNNAVVLPQAAVAAALVLGLEADAIDMRSMFSGGRGRSGAEGRGAAEGRSQWSGRTEASGMRGGGAGGPSMRGGGASGPSARGGAYGGQHSARASAPSASTEPQARRAVAFVVGQDGVIEPRMVMTRWSDWDHTQVVSGLEEGDRVALIGLAQLQARQSEMLDRIRSRSSIMGGGGSHGGGH